MKHSIPLFLLHWNSPDECLSTIDRFLSQGVELRVTVLDNFSESLNWTKLKLGIPKEVALQRLDQNRGWGGALNVVLAKWLKEDDDPICIVSAHDAQPQPDCVRRVFECMFDDPEIGMACPEYGDEAVPVYSPVRGPRVVFKARPARRGTEAVDYIHGTTMFFTRKCLKRVGLFDERYFAYGDEIEIGLRAHAQGWKLVMVWGAVLKNPGTATSGRLMSYLFGRNTLLLAETYGGRAFAIMRGLAMLPNLVRLMCRRSAQPLGFTASAKLCGIRDYFLRRFGRPGLEF